MHHIFSLNSSDYVPVSFRDRYLYDTYELIISYLKSKLPPGDLDRLLKPAVDQGGAIKWYGNKNLKLLRLSELDDDTALKIKREFHEFCSRIQNIAQPLVISKDSDSMEWGALLTKLFKPEKIILIGNESHEWAMLWGWDFKNREENRVPSLPPTLKPNANLATNEEIHHLDSIVPESLSQESRISEGTPIQPPGPPVTPEIHSSSPAPSSSKNIGCIGRIVRIFRWISYRFWGVFWLIIYTLLIIFLCCYFFNPDCNECCDQLEKTKLELDRLEEKIRARCDTLSVGE